VLPVSTGVGEPIPGAWVTTPLSHG
jgi:hypothetical protein